MRRLAFKVWKPANTLAKLEFPRARLAPRRERESPWDVTPAWSHPGRNRDIGASVPASGREWHWRSIRLRNNPCALRLASIRRSRHQPNAPRHWRFSKDFEWARRLDESPGYWSMSS